MKEKDALWVRCDGIAYRMMFNESGKRVCKKCDARTGCKAQSSLWKACGINKASYMRKLRADESVFNKAKD